MQADIIAIGLAFLFGLGARLAGLPPLIGYLIGGFVLFAAGMEATPTLHQFSEIGVTLLLFSIGLKMRIGSLLMPMGGHKHGHAGSDQHAHHHAGHAMQQ